MKNGAVRDKVPVRVLKALIALILINDCMLFQSDNTESQVIRLLNLTQGEMIVLLPEDRTIVSQD